MANLPLVIELCRTSQSLQEAFVQINAARAESEQLRQCLQSVSVQTSELSRALAASEARVEALQGERDMLSLLVTSFQYTVKQTNKIETASCEPDDDIYVP